MFHTFQSAVTPPTSGVGDGSESARPARSSGSRRISTSNACVECRRRKIRCDGMKPCGQCQWYQHPEACAYSKPAQRVVPSRKLVDKLSASIERYQMVLGKLFPSKDVEALASLPRDELLNLALSSPGEMMTSPSRSLSQPRHESTSTSDGADSLEALEAAPPQDPEWDEARKHRDRVQGISDDINGLNMSVDRQSSYVGISSITAALKVIVQAAPITRPFIAQSSTEATLPSRSGSPEPDHAVDPHDVEPMALPTVADGQTLIESYFEHVHLFFPMIDEHRFWSTYLYGDRRDSAWLALLNMVFAIGSLAAGTSDNAEHTAFFQRARRHVSLETFGSGSFELLHAMAIMSGYYMHYLNRPNEAHSLMGATLRMATALGLHREYNEQTWQHGSDNPHSDAVSAEMRRRTWWSLFCLDTWASTTMGRPSLGRHGQGITVKLPGMIPELAGPFTMPDSPSTLESLKILPLIHAAEFCKIGTVIQDRLATSPLLKFEELHQLDADLVRWREDLPPILTSDDPHSCPALLRTPRAVMKWRYQNLRIVLHRPILLSAALRGTPYHQLAPEEKVAVGKCRIIAARTIDDIATECNEDLIAGWNGVWMAFQACMVPLVSLFCCADPSAGAGAGDGRDGSRNGSAVGSTGLTGEATEWRRQVERALEFFNRMKHWSVAAGKSADFIAKLLDAVDQHMQYEHQQRLAALHAHAAAEAAASEPPPRHHPMGDPTPFVDPDSVAVAAGLQGNGLGAYVSWAEQADSLGAPLSTIWDDMAWDTFPDYPDGSYGVLGAGGAVMPDVVEHFGWPPATQENGPSGWPHGP